MIHRPDELNVERNKNHTEFEFFLPLAGVERPNAREKKNASVRIGEKFAQFYNELVLLNPDQEDKISVLLVNLVATLFSDSCGILNSGMVSHFIDLYGAADGSNLDTINCPDHTPVSGFFSLYRIALYTIVFKPFPRIHRRRIVEYHLITESFLIVPGLPKVCFSYHTRLMYLRSSVNCSAVFMEGLKNT